jgi:uncharacterized membrane protein YGL010W
MNSLPSSALLIYFKDYENYHQTKGNKLSHFIGIPFVLFSLLGLLSHITLWAPTLQSLFKIDLGFILFLSGAIFSMRVDYKLGIPFSLYAYLNYLIAQNIPVAFLIAIQVVGWFLQLWGHFRYEKKSPAFFTSLEHLFIGPMWIFAWMIGYYRPTAL